jgi:hypothetical protein
MLDDIAVVPAPRYAAKDSSLVGLCWQHARLQNLTTLDGARLEELQQLVKGGRVHVASEATVIAVGALGTSSYSARPVAALPHCKTGSAADQLNLLRGFLGWYCGEGGPHIQSALHSLFETQPLSEIHRLHPVLSRLDLLDLRCNPDYGCMTVDLDQKHLGKRMREAIKSPTRGIKIASITLYRWVQVVFGTCKVCQADLGTCKRHICAIATTCQTGLGRSTHEYFLLRNGCKNVAALLSPEDAMNVLAALELGE